ncbi:MAG: hypothetical protein WB608_16175 [Terracidiphilus sp.]
MATGTAITKSPTSAKSTMASYSEILQSSLPLPVKIKAATARLQTMLRQQLDPATLDGWVEDLSPFTCDELAWAFNHVERHVAAFPAVSQIVEVIEKRQFHEQFTLVIHHLPRFGVEWKDREAYKDSDTWDYTSAEAIAKKERICIRGKIHPAEPAPTIAPRMVRALEQFGQAGVLSAGLKRLKRDCPAFWTEDTEWVTGQHGRQASALERDLWECWLESVK